ncbi:nuclear transport factor 2 family protein [Rathayibacter sp. YIM 133350]|uniref:nuclear transport factor 2 family protein n=1 Tax=Rathayibacter sp. YIM 133350 TaxID=3131992 RepID=UPI00307E9226
MSEASAELHRLLVFEELRSLQGRLCRSLGESAWDEFERCFTHDAQLRVYEPDGSLAWFALSPHIGATIELEVAGSVLVVHAFGAELTLRSQTSAEGVWAAEYVIGGDGHALRGHCRLHQGYRHDGERWAIRSIDLIRGLQD